MNFKPANFFVATDQHYLNSSNEFLFDEFLYSRGIQHEVNGLINDKSKYRFDFKIEDYYVEIWGYDFDRGGKICDIYNNKRSKKEEFYKHHNLKLISIEGSVFRKPLKEMENYFCQVMEGFGFDVSLKKAEYSIVNSTKHYRYWNEETIIEELKVYIKEFGTFPSKLQLGKDRSDLVHAITRNKGFVYYRKNLGFDLIQNPRHYWSEKQIIQSLEKIILTTKKFTTVLDLIHMNQQGLLSGITRTGGILYYRRKLNFPLPRQHMGYWNENTILERLAKILISLDHIPSYTELKKIDSSLLHAISKRKLPLKELIAKAQDNKKYCA